MAVVESVDPAQGRLGTSPPATSPPARNLVVMNDDVARHNEGKHLQMIEIRVGGRDIRP